MKYFNCGDLHPGCEVVFRGLDAEGIAGRAGEHAEKVHGVANDGALRNSILVLVS
ncbi:MAG: DUF1059 domain-containing protein [Actinomycetales bacterium]